MLQVCVVWPGEGGAGRSWGDIRWSRQGTTLSENLLAFLSSGEQFCPSPKSYPRV